MIDHVSVGVRDLQASAAFYHKVLAPLGYQKLEDRPATVGFGKKYPEFWINLRRERSDDGDTGSHIALRASSREAVDAFHAAALASGGKSDGAPGMRPHFGEGYYAAFIVDPDGNKIEAVSFVAPPA